MLQHFHVAHVPYGSGAREAEVPPQLGRRTRRPWRTPRGDMPSDSATSASRSALAAAERAHQFEPRDAKVREIGAREGERLMVRQVSGCTACCSFA